MVKVLIVDDEPLARIRLQHHLKRMSDVYIAGQASNGLEAVQLVLKCSPDIVLMDIRMPDMDGLEAAKVIARMSLPPAVIFCTAFDDFALRAFDAQACAYLLKPVKFDELVSAIERAARQTRAQIEHRPKSQRRHLCSRTHQGIDLIPIKKILLLQAEQKYVTAYLANSEAVLSDTLKEIEEEFSDLFVRIHRSALVARDAIEGLLFVDGHLSVSVRDISIKPVVSRRMESRLRQLLPEL
ncbi:MAG: LytTR family DNA-binding domain-containing protein [Porticoccaceae bacterium]|nr:LytTR family DNA-binding domain-containing protein [Porticoccaceae bacterium]